MSSLTRYIIQRLPVANDLANELAWEDYNSTDDLSDAIEQVNDNHGFIYDGKFIWFDITGTFHYRIKIETLVKEVDYYKA
jgi:hypothetical protein